MGLMGTFLDRWSIKKKCWLLLALVIWTSAFLAPLFILERYREDLWYHNLGFTYEGWLLTLCIVPLACATELAFFWLTFGLAKGLFHKSSPILRFAGKAIAVVLVLLLAGYLFAIASSWYLYEQLGTFLESDSVFLLPFLLDFNNLEKMLSGSDFQLGVIGILVALLLSLAVFVTTSCLRTLKNALDSFLRVCVLVVAMFSVQKIVYAWHAQDFHPTIRSIANNFLSPQLSLVWGPILFGGVDAPYQVVELDLEPIESREVYLENSTPKRDLNVVLIAVEALRADVLAALGGDPQVMPELNRMVDEGILFSNTYAAASETGASQKAILTSLYALHLPHRDLNYDLDYPRTLIYDLLAEFGYQTASVTMEWKSTKGVTKSPLLDLYFDATFAGQSDLDANLPLGHGFEPIDTSENLTDGDDITIEVLKYWLSKQEPEKPFFASTYLVASHFPYIQSEPVPKLFEPSEHNERASFVYYSEAVTGVMKNRYLNTLRYVDSKISEINGHLREIGRDKNTVVVVTGDHGQAFNEHGTVAHGADLYQEVINVPLIIYGMPDFPKAEISNKPVSHVDIAPTIIDILGLPPHKNYQGQSVFVDSVKEPGECRQIFSTVQVFSHEDAVICWPWKYILNHRGRGARMFNLEVDSKESNNMIESAPTVAKQLNQALMDHRNSQLTYYSKAKPYKLESYPPQYETLKIEASERELAP